VYDRLSPRHPAAAHQDIALWVAYRHRRPVGRIGACVDSSFNEFRRVRWAWLGFFDTFDDPAVARALFDVASAWAATKGADTCVGPGSFTTNDELGLMVDGFEDPPALLTLQNPRYYENLWVGAGWEPVMDLWGWKFTTEGTRLSDRQQRTLERIRARGDFTLRQIRMDDFDAEVGRFLDVYNAAWQDNWGFAPMPEAEIRHLAKQLKQVIEPSWAIGVERPNGELVGVCLALPDMNQPMRGVRSGRLAPLGWARLLAGRSRVTNARVWALGVKPEYEHLALGPILYQAIVERLAANPRIRTAEASWTLATNHRINRQMEAMGAARSKIWRLYRRPSGRP
jgi:hypothetical protein